MKTIIPGAVALSLALVSPIGASGQLTATIVGSGSPVHDEDRASASVLISNGATRILVDMGIVCAAGATTTMGSPCVR